MLYFQFDNNLITISVLKKTRISGVKIGESDQQIYSFYDTVCYGDKTSNCNMPVSVNLGIVFEM